MLPEVNLKMVRVTRIDGTLCFEATDFIEVLANLIEISSKQSFFNQEIIETLRGFNDTMHDHVKAYITQFPKSEHGYFWPLDIYIREINCKLLQVRDDDVVERALLVLLEMAGQLKDGARLNK